MDPWVEITRLTGKKVPHWAKLGCKGPKLVTVPAGRMLYGAGPPLKTTMEWGAFGELDADWYQCGNQLDPSWYAKARAAPVSIYEYTVTLRKPTPAVMSKVADQPGAPPRIGPPKFQYYNPVGFGPPRRGRLMGQWTPP